jgi:hypothetical protein
VIVQWSERGRFLRLSCGNDTNWLDLVALAKSPYLGLTLRSNPLINLGKIYFPSFYTNLKFDTKLYFCHQKSNSEQLTTAIRICLLNGK